MKMKFKKKNKRIHPFTVRIIAFRFDKKAVSHRGTKYFANGELYVDFA